uniref:C2H2-type domain-containing protein n=1 Tax=Timema cristinae TaxID=61476 RepID=A0A7R9GUZ6_TIMCR|nr:unnamed protein product [Timema cristinae]
MAYADNISYWDFSNEGMKTALGGWNSCFEEAGMRMNIGKTEIMKVSRREKEMKIWINQTRVKKGPPSDGSDNSVWPRGSLVVSGRPRIESRADSWLKAPLSLLCQLEDEVVVRVLPFPLLPGSGLTPLTSHILQPPGQERKSGRHVNITDTLPKQLCSSCIDKLTICHKFAESCIEAEERLTVLSKWSSNKLIEPQRIEYPSDHHNCPLCVNGTIKVLDKAPKELEDAEEMECLVDIANYHLRDHENKIDSEEDVENENYSNDDQQGSKPKDTNFEESKDTIYICRMDTKGPGHKSPEEMYVCNLCETNFATQRKLSGHMRSQHGQVGSQRCIRCNTCQAIFPDISQTIMHTKTHFSGSEGGSTRVEEVCATKLFVCEYCETFFAYAEILNSHRKSHTSSKPFLCRSCPETFSNFTQADVHRRTHSNPNHLHNSSHMFTIPVVFLCEVCSRGFKLWESFHIHRLRDHEKLQESGLWLQGSDGIYECELCPDTFEQKKQLLGHIKLEHLKKKFECDECGKVKITLLKYHCQYCGRAFSRWNALRLHIRTHTGEKPYVCEVCNRAFAQKGDMRKHRRTQHPPVQ